MINLIPPDGELPPEHVARNLALVLKFIGRPFEDGMLTGHKPGTVHGFLIILDAVSASLDELTGRIAELQRIADACTCRRAAP